LQFFLGDLNNGRKALLGSGIPQNKQKTKTTRIGYVAFPKNGKDTETNEWRNKLNVCVGRFDDSAFNPDKHHICMAHFEHINVS